MKWEFNPGKWEGESRRVFFWRPSPAADATVVTGGEIPLSSQSGKCEVGRGKRRGDSRLKPPSPKPKTKNAKEEGRTVGVGRGRGEEIL